MDTLRLERFRPYVVSFLLLAGTGGFAYFAHGFYPIRTWLFWRYASYWLVIGPWLLCCTAFGYELTARYCRWLTKLEQLTVGVAVGVLCFALAIFACGLVHGLHPVTAVLLPLAFLAFGGKRLWHDTRKLARRSRFGFEHRFDLRVVPVWLLALLGVFVLYFSLLSPETFTFDARWYHMPMAQRYALSGKIARFDEGFWMSAFPQMLSYLYAWVFLLPRALMFDRMELCAHIEFFLFVATLAQIPILVRRLAPNAPWQLSWCLRLAFPGVYLYDGNLNAGADHVAGFFTLPLALAVLRAWPRFEWRRVALVAVLISAVALVKYTSWAVCASAGIVVGLRGLWLGSVRRKWSAWTSLGVLGGVILVVTAPHWLKNLAWYGDPLYPQLAGIFPSSPWGPEFEARRADLDGIRRGAPLNAEGLKAALESTLTFSFIPNEWEFLHRDVPVFGSLFTLTLPCLLFLKRAGKLWGIYLSTMLAIVFWYMLAHYDRYLQTLVPLMAAGTAACFARVWQLGLVPRLAVSALVAFQVIWGLDVPFFRTHNLIGDSPIRHVSQFLASGFDKRPHRLELFQPMPAIGKAIPRDAVVLTHDSLLILGMDRQWVSDQNQSRISYGALRSPHKIHRLLESLGVTHLVWPDNSVGVDSIAGDLAFYGYALRYTHDRKAIGGYTVSTLPAQPPPESWSNPLVAYFGCGSPYRTGWYPLSELTRRLPGMPAAKRSATLSKDMAVVAAHAGFVVVERDCQSDVAVGAPFQLAARRGRAELYLRKEPFLSPPPAP
jgi:hypothetical protein